MRTRKPIQKTPWFAPDIKPVRAGIYETWFLNSYSLGYSYWDGLKWSSQYQTQTQVLKHTRASGVQWKHWRGLIQKGHHPISEN